MAHYIGKIIFNKFLGFRIADVWNEDEMRDEKCIVIPIQQNGIQKWNNEWQFWFRGMAYRNPQGSFSHFLMKYISTKDIRKMSARQIELFANHNIGVMKKTSNTQNTMNQEDDLDDFINKNI